MSNVNRPVRSWFGTTCKPSRKIEVRATLIFWRTELRMGEYIQDPRSCPKTISEKEVIELACPNIKPNHNEEKVLKCDFCDAIFTSKRGLNNHVKLVHEENKSFKCEICDFPFKSKLGSCIFNSSRQKTIWMQCL